MKKPYLLAAIFLLLVFGKAYAQVGIGTTTPDGSAMLDVTSASKGVLVPRMRTAQRTTGIPSPAEGLLVYDTDTRSFWFFKSGLGWTEVGSAQAPVAFNAYLAAPQTIPNYTFTTLAPYTEYLDNTNSFNPATGIFTVPLSGFYHFDISVEVAAPAANSIYVIQCSSNGGLLTGGQKTALIPALAASFNVSVSFSFDIQLNAGDAFGYQFLQRTGAGATVFGSGATQTTFFSGYKIY